MCVCRGIKCTIPRVPEYLSLRPNLLPSPHVRKRVFPSLLGTKVLGQHSLAGEGALGANSDDLRESLARDVWILKVFGILVFCDPCKLVLRPQQFPTRKNVKEDGPQCYETVIILKIARKGLFSAHPSC
jgi:hypothetical protein